MTTSAPSGGNDDRKKAQVFFDRAQTVAQTQNYEFAIEMYLQGLRLAPNAVDAVQALRDISLVRKASGGKDMGMMQRMKLPKAIDAKQKMLNALQLLAYSPGDKERMLAVAQSAVECHCDDIAQWAVKLVERSNQEQRRA
jgi:hypothetical protein